MGVDITKKTIVCTCGCDYGGDCGKVKTYVFTHNTVVDVYGLYVDGVRIWSGNDDDLTALMHVLTAEENDEELTNEERKYC